jgi:probable rRNA maturation factor
MTVDVSVSCPAWTADLPEAAKIAERAVRAAARAAFRRAGRFEVSVLLADDATQRGLNRNWRGQDRSTNVLAFPALEPAKLAAAAAAVKVGEIGLGDIVLAHGTVRREARMQGKTLADHVSHLSVHGFLHLIGYDHAEADEAERMEALEVGVLGRLGIDDPYAGERRPVPGRGLRATLEERGRR